MKRPGQTLLELVIAISVISVSTIAAITLVVRTITVGTASRTKTEATNYAREGLEIVRMIRDSNWLKIDQNLPDGTSDTTQWDDASPKKADYQPLAANGAARHYVLTYDPNGVGWDLERCTATGVDGECSADKQKIWQIISGAQVLYARQACTTLTSGCSASYRITPYSRDITITRETDTSGGLTFLNVQSKVTWSTSDGAHTITMSTRLYDWK